MTGLRRELAPAKRPIRRSPLATWRSRAERLRCRILRSGERAEYAANTARRAAMRVGRPVVSDVSLRDQFLVQESGNLNRPVRELRAVLVGARQETGQQIRGCLPHSPIVRWQRPANRKESLLEREFVELRLREAGGLTAAEPPPCCTAANMRAKSITRPSIVGGPANDCPLLA